MFWLSNLCECKGPRNMIDWCCFYYFLRNSLVALLEALFAAEVPSEVTEPCFEVRYLVFPTSSCLETWLVSQERPGLDNASTQLWPDAKCPYLRGSLSRCLRLSRPDKIVFGDNFDSIAILHQCSLFPFTWGVSGVYRSRCLKAIIHLFILSSFWSNPT